MSSSPGRNDPCPCGSGRKFNRCCALRPAVAGAIFDDDFDRACEALGRLTASARFEEDLAIAHEMCFDAQADGADDGAPTEAGDDPADDLEALHDDLFAEWLWFDYLSRDRRTAAARILAGDVSALTPGARRVLAAAIAAPLRCLRVE